MGKAERWIIFPLSSTSSPICVFPSQFPYQRQSGSGLAGGSCGQRSDGERARIRTAKKRELRIQFSAFDGSLLLLFFGQPLFVPQSLNRIHPRRSKRRNHPANQSRSEERRVGKECRSRGS